MLNFPLTYGTRDQWKHRIRSEIQIWSMAQFEVSDVVSQDGWSVTYTSQSICALKDSSVDISCSYTHPSVPIVTKTFWFNKRLEMEEPVDLSQKLEYQGRVKYDSKENHHTLTITNLKESDSGEYYFRFLTKEAEGHYGTPPVSLTITDLQVTVSPNTVREGQRVTLTCNTTCTLSNNPTYIWYRNNQPVTNKHRHILYLDSVSSEDTGSYSCAVQGQENLHSPAVCKFEFKSCWSVNYPERRIVAVKGSSVDMPCTYTYPSGYTVIKTFWFNKWEKPEDLSQNRDYQGRVEYLGNKENNCSLRIRNLRESDSEEFSFRFITDRKGGRFAGSPGVSLSVADSDPVYDNVSAVAMTSDPTQRVNTDDQGDVHYANVQFSHSKRQEVSLYSTTQHQQPDKQEEDVQYVTVNFSRASAAPQPEATESSEDPSVIYSQINKHKP
ncbi:uncharacterized protein LOC115819322 [Chanos chanos]|uniref:B-cell receptor CD22 n=1 Tax=Chanos chanos TaxID=29144 RepID=A0A6J2W3U3_CHACN|nr:uncharacterized protein LOC115819322 [Chanos chanos]